MATSPTSQGTKAERRAHAKALREAAERDQAASEQRRRRLLQLGGVIAGVAAVIVAIVLATGGKDDATKTPVRQAGESVPGQTASNALFAGIPQSGLTLGSSKAPVTLVEFADLQCPFCREYTTGVLPTLVQKYVRTGKVRMEFRNLSFIGAGSVAAGKVAAAASQQNKLWPFIDLLYANQGEENTGYVTPAFLRRIAGGVSGLDVDKAIAASSTSAATNSLAAASNLAQTRGISSTPSFLIGRTGKTLKALNVTSLTPQQFTSAIDSELS